ncbi:MAG: S8 family serine peptidase [bacterium]|nr:S8 family serine peptidase [bacterium]
MAPSARQRVLLMMSMLIAGALAPLAALAVEPSAPLPVPRQERLAAAGRMPIPTLVDKSAPGRHRVSARQAAPATRLPFQDLDLAALAALPPNPDKSAPAVAAALADPFLMRVESAAGGRGAPRNAPVDKALPWSGDRLLANPTDMNDEYVSLARSPLTGHLYAAFAATDLGGTDRDIHVSRSTDDGLTWTTWEAESTATDEFQPEMAIDGGGFIHLVWVTGDGTIMRSRSAQPDNPTSWAFTYGLPSGEVLATPSIAVSGAGDFATVFYACSWLTANQSTFQYEWTLLWMYSTNGGQSITYDYFLPDGYPDYWPDVTMDSGTVTMVNGEADMYTGEMEIVVATDTYAGTFNDLAMFTGWTGYNCGFPRVAGQGQQIFVVYQHDWTDGVVTDGDIVYTYSWDGGTSWFGPFDLVADEYESVGPAVTARDGVVGCFWLDAPPGGDEFNLAATLAGGSGQSTFFQSIETVTDAPRVDPTFHAADAIRSDERIHAAWIDRRDFTSEGHNVYTSRRELQADLAAFTPAGWDTCLLATPVPGQRADSWVVAGDTTWVSFAVANVGLAQAAGTFRLQLDLDETPVAAWNVTDLGPASYITVEDHPLVVGAGPHALTLRLDPLDDVPESDETDNVCSRTFHWLTGEADLRVAPDRLVVTMAPEATKSLASSLAADPPLRTDLRLRVLAAGLARQLDKAGGDVLLPVIVQPAEIVDAPGLAKALSGTAPDLRRTTVLAAARGQLARSRARLQPVLEDLQRAGLAGEIRPLWLPGVLKVQLSATAVRRLAGHPDVGALWLDDSPCRSFGGPPSIGSPDKADAWHLAAVGADLARDQGLTGDGVLVGHLDSGVAYDHPDLAQAMWDGGATWPNHGWDFVDDDSDPYDGDTSWYHGTHTAGLVVGDGSGGTTTGVAPGATLMALRTVPGYFEDLADALQFGLDRGVDLFTFSGGWTNPDEGIRTANRHQAELLMAAGVPWITSVGNGDNTGGHFAVPHDVASPGDCPGPAYAPNGGATAVISVGATTSSGAVWNGSSFGPTVWDVDNPHGTTDYHDYPWPPGLIKPDLAAPGDLVTSTAGLGGYVSYSGTSMACPIAAGAAALLLERAPDLTPALLAATFEATAVDVTASPAAPGRDNYSGAGLIDIPAALVALPNAATTSFRVHNDGTLPLLLAPPTDPVDWLAADVAATTVQPGDSTVVTVVLTPDGLAAGLHETDISLASNDPDGPHLVPVVLDWGAGASHTNQDVPSVAAGGLDNYPNPFNPRTVLRFTALGTGRTVLDIHDLRGRRVRRLIDATLPAGPATAQWDGTDDRGRAVGSGQYVARLVEGGTRAVTRKLMLVR